MSYRHDRPRPVASTMNRLPAFILFAAVALFIAADLLLGFDFNWVDYALVIIISFFGYKGYVKGLINAAFGLFGYAVGLIGAFLFSEKLALILMQKTALGKIIGEKIKDVIPLLSQVTPEKISENKSTFDMISQMPDVNKALTENPILKYLTTVTSTAAETSPMYKDVVITANDLVVLTILKVVALVVLFIVIKLLVVLLGKLITSILGSSALLGTANRTAGMIIGLGVGVIICYIVFVLAIPTLASMNLIKIPDNYTQSIMLDLFNKSLLLLRGENS